MRIATLLAVYMHNDPEQVRQAVDSIVSQNLAEGIDSRIYLGIDGRIPESLENLIQEYRSSFYRIVRSSLNLGLAATLNSLIETLEDETLLFRMDADDISMADRYQAQIDFLAENPQVHILGTAIIEFGEGIKHPRKVMFAQNSRDAFDNAHRRVPVAHPTVCMRRSVVELVGGYPTYSGTNEDVAFWFKCFEAGLVFDNLPDAHLYYRIGSTFWERRSVQKSFLELKTYTIGIYKIYGFPSLRYAFPVMRFILRLAPTWLSRSVYSSRLRALR